MIRVPGPGNLVVQRQERFALRLAANLRRWSGLWVTDNGCGSFANTCRATPRQVWHIRPMRRQFLQALAGLRPMIKTCWEVLLRAGPPCSPLGNPDTLVFMMDQTLDDFFAAARSPTPRRWLGRYPLLCNSLAETCSCDQNPLLNYFVSGEQAILAIAGQTLAGLTPGTEDGEQILSEVQLVFHYLAQHELQTFCDLCREKCVRARAGIATGHHRTAPKLPSQTHIPRLRLQWGAAGNG